MSEIQPALTPENWETSPDDQKHLRYKTTYFGDLHAVAALALHGQPFGFHPNDVDELRRWADIARDASDDSEQAGVDAVRLDSIADRIAALLPPRE